MDFIRQISSQPGGAFRQTRQLVNNASLPHNGYFSIMQKFLWAFKRGAAVTRLNRKELINK